jgi:hypothetical protein
MAKKILLVVLTALIIITMTIATIIAVIVFAVADLLPISPWVPILILGLVIVAGTACLRWLSFYY